MAWYWDKNEATIGSVSTSPQALDPQLYPPGFNQGLIHLQVGEGETILRSSQHAGVHKLLPRHGPCDDWDAGSGWGRDR